MDSVGSTAASTDDASTSMVPPPLPMRPCVTAAAPKKRAAKKKKKKKKKSTSNCASKRPGPRARSCPWCSSSRAAGAVPCTCCHCPGYSACTHVPGAMCVKVRYGRRLVCNPCERAKLAFHRAAKRDGTHVPKQKKRARARAYSDASSSTEEDDKVLAAAVPLKAAKAVPVGTRKAGAAWMYKALPLPPKRQAIAAARPSAAAGVVPVAVNFAPGLVPVPGGAPQLQQPFAAGGYPGAGGGYPGTGGYPGAGPQTSSFSGLFMNPENFFEAMVPPPTSYVLGVGGVGSAGGVGASTQASGTGVPVEPIHVPGVVVAAPDDGPSFTYEWHVTPEEAAAAAAAAVAAEMRSSSSHEATPCSVQRFEHILNNVNFEMPVREPSMPRLGSSSNLINLGGHPPSVGRPVEFQQQNWIMPMAYA